MRHTTANSSFGCEKIYEEVLRQRLYYSVLPRLRLDQFYWQNDKKLALLEASILSESSLKNTGKTKGNQ